MGQGWQSWGPRFLLPPFFLMMCTVYQFSKPTTPVMRRLQLIHRTHSIWT